MADYMVGKGGKGSKDRYMVGWNGGKESPYKIGGGGSSISDSSNKNLGGGDQASPTGQKSAFNYKDIDPKDIGDKSENMNFGGQVTSGIAPAKGLELEYSQKGGYDGKDAMARRKANLDAAKGYMANGDRYDSPVPSAGKK